MATFLSAFLEVSSHRIASSRVLLCFFEREIDLNFDGQILNRLERTLITISAVLQDAEDTQPKSRDVTRWLATIKDSVSIADDLLDEFNTESLRLQLEYKFLQKAGTRVSLNPAVILGLGRHLDKVTQRLEYFVTQIDFLCLKKSDRKARIPCRAPSTSVVDKSEIFGRDDEKKELIERVLSDGGDSDVSAIAITGIGGIGKTTLAKFVYNDHRVKEKFETRAWLSVSKHYDRLRIIKALLMEVNSGAVDDKDGLNWLQLKLRDNLAGKRFLIIMDNFSNDNYNAWISLKNPLNCGSRGSKIIVTARNQNVVSMMQNEIYHLQPIPEDHSWSLFKYHAFDNGGCTSPHEFERVGEQIVNKCKGLPLAIKTIAAALRPERDINVWHELLSSKDWALGGDILPALGLSYKHLPTHLKACFAFCSLFQEDVPFDKDELVLLWMANDLVKPSTQKVGRIYFEELKSRSFFESVDGKEYLMHELINDLAQSVAGDTCIRLEDYGSYRQENDLPQEVLHFSYFSTSNETFKRFGRLGQTRSLRTFLPIHQSRDQRHITTNFFTDMFPRFYRLRALNLSRYSISMVPDLIGDLKHLRFLNLASTDIQKLPNDISKCLNLHTLILANCYELVELPNDIGKCVNLQTLILANCNKLVELPEDMRLLINLQHLDVRGIGKPLIEKNATWLSIFKDIQNISVVVDKIHGSVSEHLDKLQLCPSLNIIGSEDEVTIEDKDCIENLTHNSIAP